MSTPAGQSEAGEQLTRFLPMTRREMQARGWEELDVLLISGDAYVDHPSFGIALVGRWLEAKGYRVGVVAQPAWRDAKAVAALGRPRLFAGVSAGAMDSMLNLYTANKKRRSKDAYSPGGRNDRRPPRSTIVYCNLLRQAFPGLPIVIGGVEASLRRLAHYDYWDDRVRSSILLDSGAEVLVYGMGERAVLEVARRLARSGTRVDLRFIAGTVFAGEESDLPGPDRTTWLPSREEIEAEPARLLTATALAAAHANPYTKHYLAQRDGQRLVIAVHPQRPLKTAELDAIYELPFTRQAHFSYKEPVPALEPVRFSVTCHRGCYGGCTFCALHLHQGKVIQSRSVRSIRREIERLGQMDGFRGVISDLGGPTANMYGTGCARPEVAARCKRASCLYPRPCPHLQTSHQASLDLLAAVRKLACVKQAYVASGVRFDLALADPRYIDVLAAHHTGGHLSVAPEHCVERVLRMMRKPRIAVFEAFRKRFDAASRRAGKEQYLIPYLLCSFPGCTEPDMQRLGDYLRSHGLVTRQVQDFVPTPMTLATAMYYSGRSAQGKELYVAHTPGQRLRQQRLLKGLPARRRAAARPPAGPMPGKRPSVKGE